MSYSIKELNNFLDTEINKWKKDTLTGKEVFYFGSNFGSGVDKLKKEKDIFKSEKIEKEAHKYLSDTSKAIKSLINKCKIKNNDDKKITEHSNLKSIKKYAANIEQKIQKARSFCEKTNNDNSDAMNDLDKCFHTLGLMFNELKNMKALPVEKKLKEKKSKDKKPKEEKPKKEKEDKRGFEKFNNSVHDLINNKNYEWNNTTEDITADTIHNFTKELNTKVIPLGMKSGISGFLAKYTGIGSKSTKLLKDILKNTKELEKISKDNRCFGSTSKVNKIKEITGKVASKIRSSKKLFKGEKGDKETKALLSKTWDDFEILGKKFEALEEYLEKKE